MKRNANKYAVGALMGLCSTFLTIGTATAETTVRLQSASEQASFSEGYALSVEDWSKHTLLSRSNTSDHFWHQSQSRPQVWISDIGTLLFDDSDRDGYHAGFSLTIDVDSEYGDTEVYAKIYMESDATPLTLLHKTNRFAVYGTTIGDEYRVDTELRSNFSSDDYDIVIDIHDAWTDTLIDTANARGFENLRQLPLESAEQQHYSDLNSETDYESDALDGTDDVVVTEYGGALHPLFALFLGLAALRHSKRIKRAKQ